MLLGSKARVRLYRGDRLIIETSKGGGWGTPLERASADVAEELISPQRAREAYGVVIASGGVVDEEATQRERARRSGGL